MGAAAPTETPAETSAEPPSFDELIKSNKAYQREFDKRVTGAINTAKTKWEADAKAKADEAARLAQMSAEEKAAAEREAAIKALDEREAAITKRELKAEAKLQLAEKKLPAEDLITAVILIIAEFCPPEKRHIISSILHFQQAVSAQIQDLLAPSNIKGKTKFKLLMDKLPSKHKARWYAGAALNSAEQAMNSVMSTAMSRLNAFLDSELEQILCFDTSIDVEHFCDRKSAIYLVLPEEDATKHFLISLIFQQLYREMLTVADEKGGQLKKRVMFYMDEIGSATRS